MLLFVVDLVVAVVVALCCCRCCCSLLLPLLLHFAIAVVVALCCRRCCCRCCCSLLLPLLLPLLLLLVLLSLMQDLIVLFLLLFVAAIRTTCNILFFSNLFLRRQPGHPRLCRRRGQLSQRGLLHHDGGLAKGRANRGGKVLLLNRRLQRANSGKVIKTS